MRIAILLVFLALLAMGCGRFYHLPGHNSRNITHPPPVTMKVGERCKAISTGMTLMMPIPADMTSSDTNVVSVEIPDYYTAYLVAHRTGTATVTYYPGWDSLRGSFELRVVERKSK